MYFPVRVYWSSFLDAREVTLYFMCTMIRPCWLMYGKRIRLLHARELCLCVGMRIVSPFLGSDGPCLFVACTRPTLLQAQEVLVSIGCARISTIFHAQEIDLPSWCTRSRFVCWMCGDCTLPGCTGTLVIFGCTIPEVCCWCTRSTALHVMYENSPCFWDALLLYMIAWCTRFKAIRVLCENQDLKKKHLLMLFHGCSITEHIISKYDD